MKIRTVGRGLALISVAAVVFAACSSSSASTAPSAAAPSAGASAAAGGSAAAGAAMKIGYLPKDIVNQYFAAAKTGIDKGAAEFGLDRHPGRTQ